MTVGGGAVGAARALVRCGASAETAVVFGRTSVRYGGKSASGAPVPFDADAGAAGASADMPSSVNDAVYAVRPDAARKRR